jgi:serine/threonine protein phosphatase 1
MGRLWVIGDIHGAYRALKQCLERSGFDREQDHLISLGDVSDGWPETRACIDELLTIPNLTFILGNHDSWTLQWMKTGLVEDLWLRQGGEATINSYADGVPTRHVKFLENAPLYFIKDNTLFVHAGIKPSVPIEKQSADILLWDRDFARIALDFYLKGLRAKVTEYEEVYIGHTPIPFNHPIQSNEIWLMDTGAGWSGVLSIMDVENKEIFCSDPVPELYPGVKGRMKK